MATPILLIDGKKLRKVRGVRSRAEIVRAANNVFSPQQLLAWEADKYRPRPEILPALLKALGVDLRDISLPMNGKSKRRAA